jgi:hypothetical protein
MTVIDNELEEKSCLYHHFEEDSEKKDNIEIKIKQEKQ